MSGSDPKSLVDQLVGACFTVLLGAVALYCAVQVLRAVLPFLIVGIGIAALVAVGIAVVRWRRGRW